MDDQKALFFPTDTLGCPVFFSIFLNGAEGVGGSWLIVTPNFRWKFPS